MLFFRRRKDAKVKRASVFPWPLQLGVLLFILFILYKANLFQDGAENVREGFLQARPQTADRKAPESHLGVQVIAQGLSGSPAARCGDEVAVRILPPGAKEPQTEAAEAPPRRFRLGDTAISHGLSQLMIGRRAGDVLEVRLSEAMIRTRTGRKDPTLREAGRFRLQITDVFLKDAKTRRERYLSVGVEAVHRWACGASLTMVATLHNGDGQPIGEPLPMTLTTGAESLSPALADILMKVMPDSRLFLLFPDEATLAGLPGLPEGAKPVMIEWSGFHLLRDAQVPKTSEKPEPAS